MSKPVSKSVHQAVQNFLTILAKQGDKRAIAALQNTDDIEVIDTGETVDVQMIVGQPDGEFVVTEHGASFLPKSDEE
ncbi:hypothetical protein [Phormidesmis priestleyi]